MSLEVDNKVVSTLGSEVGFNDSVGLYCDKYIRMLCFYYSVQPLFMAAYEGVPGSPVRPLHIYSEPS